MTEKTTEKTTHLTREDLLEIISYLDIIWRTEQERARLRRMEKINAKRKQK